MKSLAANAVRDKGLLNPNREISNEWYYHFMSIYQDLVLSNCKRKDGLSEQVSYDELFFIVKGYTYLQNIVY